MIDELIETQKVFAFLNNKLATESQLQELIQIAERIVHQYYPHAKPIFTTNKQGSITHVGIYNVQLLLNERGQFKPIQQFAPQLLSNHVGWNELHHTGLKLKILVDLWLDVVFRVFRDNPEYWQQARKEMELIGFLGHKQ
jgi:hypothetical protein